jgi:hypothetical protein
LIGKRFEREPMIMVVSMPPHLMACLQEKVHSLLVALQEFDGHEPGRMHLVLLLKLE